MDLLAPPDDGDVELALRCRASLRTFIREAWPVVEPATPFISGWHIDCISEHLEAQSAGELPRLIINIPPRTMKSLTTGVFWPAWEWLFAPHTRWLFASYAEKLAQRDSVKMRRLLRSGGGREDGNLFERIGYQGVLSRVSDQPWDLSADQDAKTKYENTATGMRQATGVGGIATGEGGDRIVIDDPLNAKQARSEKEREAVNTWWDETMTTRFNNAQATATLVMQRLHKNDLTGHLLEQGGWHHLCLPAEYEPKHPFVYPDKVFTADQTYVIQGEDGSAETITVKGGRLLPGDPRTTAGELLDPVRLPKTRLVELERDMGSYGYAGQQQQVPSPVEGGQFKREWWKRWTNLPPQWERVVASWDMRFSDSQQAASSYVVGQVWGIDGADRYLLAQIRARLSFTESVKAVQALAQMHPEAKAKLVERKANGAAVIDTLQRKVPGLIPIEPEGGKEVRAAAVEPYVESGNVFLPDTTFIPVPAGYKATNVQDFIEEHAVFPNGTHDDQVDAMSQALNWLEHRGSKVSTQSRLPTGKPTVVRKGDLVLVGDHHVDKR